MQTKFDIALVCTNGHVVNSYSATEPEYNTKFCKDCGAPTISHCPECDTEIPGGHIGDWKEMKSAPAFCHECGLPYPWTQSKLEAAEEMIDMFDEIDEADKQKLKDSLPDIARQTPKSDVAAKRWQTIARKIGGDVYGALIKVGTDVASLLRLGCELVAF